MFSQKNFPKKFFKKKFQKNFRRFLTLNIGASIMHQEHIQALWKIISPEEENFKGYHGAGTRFFDDKKLAQKCIKYLPEEEPKVYDIQPNFDVDMDLLGWYDTENKSGGQNMWLRRTGEDDRKLQKYYNHTDGWLFAFEPKYV